VDIAATYGALAGTLLSATNRLGRYGGSFENRSRFLLETLQGIRKSSPSLLLATRLCAYAGVRDGFGVSKSDYRKTDLTEPLKLVENLYLSGVRLLNITSASPNLRGSSKERPLQPFSDSDEPDEHPLTIYPSCCRWGDTEGLDCDGWPWTRSLGLSGCAKLHLRAWKHGGVGHLYALQCLFCAA